MPPSWAGRGAAHCGKLQAFVRGRSEGSITTNNIPTDDVLLKNHQYSKQPVVQPVPPPAITSGPVRKVPIESPRKPLNNSGRLTAPLERARSSALNANANMAPFQPPLRSPTQSDQGSPTIQPKFEPPNTKVDIFEGSQLGESFMESGLSTPHNEPEDPISFAPRPQEGYSRNGPVYQSPNRFNHMPRPPRSNREPKFVIGEDGRLSVGLAVQRHATSNMRDGFQNGTAHSNRKNSGQHQNGTSDFVSSFEQEAKLPMRQVKIRSSQPRGVAAYGGNDQTRTLSPTPRHVRKQSKTNREDEKRFSKALETDDEIESQADEELQTTPKPAKTKSLSQIIHMDSSLPPARPRGSPSKSRKRRRTETDYDDEALAGMSFQDLQKQSFDYDPSKAAEQRAFGSGGNGLAEKLDQCRHFGAGDQRDFFANMPIDDWEASGQWFADRFSSLMGDLILARQNKRRLVQQFENEAATREEAVRLRTQAIDQKLAKMRQDGQRVVGTDRSRP